MAGKKLADGGTHFSRMAFSEVRGDEEYMAWVFGWNSYRHDYICHRCFASKSVKDLAFTDLCLETAGWLSTLVSHENYLNNTPPAERAPFFELHGFHAHRALKDSMHGINLGTGQHAAGNALWELTENNCARKSEYDSYLCQVWVDFKDGTDSQH